MPAVISEPDKRESNVANREISRSMRDLTLRLRDNVRNNSPQMGTGCVAIPVENYYSQTRYEQEMASVFRRYPIIVGHRDQCSQTGDVFRHDALQMPLLITRDGEGRVRCFLNACRHRSMRLQEAPSACAKKSFVCPYHGWTYGLDGHLKNVPHEYAFPTLNKETSGLVELPCAQRHGFIWVLPAPGVVLNIEHKLDEYLGSIGEDFTVLGLDNAALYKHSSTPQNANWKLIIDAFLEAYHVRVLHRNSIYPFFEDSMAASDTVSPHLRSAVARRGLAQTEQLPDDQHELRNLVSYTHFIFPNTIIIFHPDYASALTFFPDGPERLRWVHQMLIPEDEHTQARAAHWQKTLNLIEQTVFAREDLFAAEGMQVGLRSGANQHMNLGRLEYLIDHFHARIQDAIDAEN